MQNVKTCERMSFGMVEMRFVFAIKYLSKYANNSLASFFFEQKVDLFNYRLCTRGAFAKSENARKYVTI